MCIARDHNIVADVVIVQVLQRTVLVRAVALLH